MSISDTIIITLTGLLALVTIIAMIRRSQHIFGNNKLPEALMASGTIVFLEAITVLVLLGRWIDSPQIPVILSWIGTGAFVLGFLTAWVLKRFIEWFDRVAISSLAGPGRTFRTPAGIIALLIAAIPAGLGYGVYKLTTNMLTRIEAVADTMTPTSATPAAIAEHFGPITLLYTAAPTLGFFLAVISGIIAYRIQARRRRETHASFARQINIWRADLAIDDVLTTSDGDYLHRRHII